MDSESDQSEVDSVSDHSEVTDSDSDHSDVDPAHAARAALLLARFAAAIQATKELQALRNKPQLLALEKLVFKCLDAGDAAFLKQKRIFRMMPGRLMEEINRELGPQWRRPPLVGVMANPHTRHLSLHLGRPAHWEGEVEGWTLEQLDLLCSNIALECKTSLLSLEIESHEPRGKYPGLHLAQLSSLLLELRALTSLHIECYLQMRETDLLVSILASTNPDIRSLQLPNLSNKSLCTIADRWPQLEALQADQRKFNDSQLETVLLRLRNLEKLEISGKALSRFLLTAARAHDPASPPYKLAEGFAGSSSMPVSSEDMIRLFTAFPALYWLQLLETDIPAVCAGLEGREHVHITELEVEFTSTNPRALEPLLALVGKHLIKLEVDDEHRDNRVDLNMIGHYCPKLQDLQVYAGELVAGDEFEVTETYFSKLELCNLHQKMPENGPLHLPTELVCCVLASPTLEDFESRGVSITEEVVAALAAERGRGALSSLEEVFLSYHAALDVGVLAELASHAPLLRSITIETGNVRDEGVVEMKGVLDSFMQQSELGVEISVVHW